MSSIRTIGQRFPTKQNQASAIKSQPRGSGPPERCLRSPVCSKTNASSGGLFLAFSTSFPASTRECIAPELTESTDLGPSAKVGNVPEANLMSPAKRPWEPRGWDVLADAWFSLWEIVGLSLWLSSIKVLWLLILIIRKQLCFYALKIVFDSLVRFCFFGLKEKKKN